MSVYNGQRYLRQAIESILRQTWTDYEFLIINDDSTDNSREIITDFDDPRIRLMDNSANMGLTKSLNRGLELARGELVARQDADDVSHPARLEKQVHFLDTHPEVVLLGTQPRLVNRNGHPMAFARGLTKPTTNAAIKWCLMFRNAFVHTSMMFQREVVWERFHGYCERFTRSQDFELWSRIAHKHEVRNLPHVLVDRRFHSESMAARERKLHARLGEEVIAHNLERFSGFERPPEEWASLINLLRAGRTVKDPQRLMVIVDSLFAQYCAVHPSAAAEQEIRSCLADQLGLIAYQSATQNRRASLSAYVWACRTDARILTRGITENIPAIQYFALLVLGESARRAHRLIKSN